MWRLVSRGGLFGLASSLRLVDSGDVFFLILANDKSQNKIRRAPACERNVSSAYLLLCMSYTEGGEITFGFLALRKF